MYNNQWGGPMELSMEADDDNRSNPSFSDFERSRDTPSRRMLDETQQSWLLEPQSKKKAAMVDLGCMTCNRKCFWWFICLCWTCCVIVALSIVIWKFAPRKHHPPPSPDNYTVALGMALNFFDAQKSGYLPPGDNSIQWRGSSALLDGNYTQDGKAVNLTGGFYDAGDNIKFGFPGAYAMTLLSWSVIEYEAKFKAAGELEHVKEIIKWGTDYMLKSFNATALDRIYCQVGTGGDVGNANDHYCWERPEDLDYFDYPRRLAISVFSGSDLAGEMTAALSAASIVFKDQADYSQQLLTGAKALYKFGKDKPALFVDSIPQSERPFYNSSHYNDEMIWGGTWLYFASGNITFLNDVTIHATNNSVRGPGNVFGVFDWDSKLVGAQLLLTRLRILQGPGYPFEQVLRQYQNETTLVMCAYLPQFQTFNRTKGGLTLFNQKAPQPLPAVANAAFLAALYVDYMEAADVPVWQCGPNWFPLNTLRNFSHSQVDYILGKNPMNMSYLVGYSDRYPTQVHHRAASMPSDGHRYSCTEGWNWRDRHLPNPHVLQGAMVGGPDNDDRFNDSRSNPNQNEPTVAGNAGLVAALVALSSPTGGAAKAGVDPNAIFAAIPSYVPSPPPPQAPWTP